MQIAHVFGLKKRFTSDTAKTYASQVERGEDHPKFNVERERLYAN